MTGDVIEFAEGFLEASNSEATKRPCFNRDWTWLGRRHWIL